MPAPNIVVPFQTTYGRKKHFHLYVRATIGFILANILGIANLIDSEVFRNFFSTDWDRLEIRC